MWGHRRALIRRREIKDTIIAPKEKLLSKLASQTAALVFSLSRDVVVIFVSYFMLRFITALVTPGWNLR